MELEENNKKETNENLLNKKDRDLPNQLVIGYFENISKKELRIYIINYAQKYFEVPSKTYYAMKKYKDGYMYEIHDGKKELSCLKNVIKELNTKDEIIIKSKKRNLKVINNGSKIDCFLLNEKDNALGENLFEKGSMEYVIPKGTGLFVMGIVLAGLGTLSITGSFVFKYVLYNQTTENFKEKIVNYELPLEKFNTLEPATESRYVSSLEFKNNNWKINYKDIPIEEDIIEENIEDYIDIIEDDFSFEDSNLIEDETEGDFSELELTLKNDINEEYTLEKSVTILDKENDFIYESIEMNIKEEEFIKELEEDIKNENYNNQFPEYYLEDNNYYDGDKYKKEIITIEDNLNKNNLDVELINNYQSNEFIEIDINTENDGKEPEYYLKENNYYDGDKYNSIENKIKMASTLNIKNVAHKIIIEERK